MPKPIPKHPQQPLVIVDGVVRFKSNPLIKALLMEFRGGLNRLSIISQDSEHWHQLLQLTGYSVDGYCDYESVTKDEVTSLMDQVGKLVG